VTLTLFWSIVAIHLAAAISPGPSFVVSLRIAASDGFGVATALAFSFGLGAVLWATAAMGGIAILFELVPVLFIGLKVIGGAFLMFVAFMMWRHAKEPIALNDENTRPRSTWSAFRFGFLTFATNPKPAIFFGAVFVGLVPPEATLGWKAAILLAVFLIETLWYIFVAKVFSTNRARNLYSNAKAWIDRAFGTLIAVFGLKIALT
jgi:threonine/homoserine/homoserine lactone efflux protein